MKAAFALEACAAEGLKYGDQPNPQPSPTQCLVRILASAVNPIDTYLRAGAIPMQVPWPFIPGCDLAGEIVAVGSGVKRFRIGQRVWGSNQGLLGRQGTLAEYAAADESLLYELATGVEPRQAAATALVGITAHLGLFKHARLREGESIFVRGGSGGVGSMVVQMAKRIGARVITTAGNKEKESLCRHFGADEVILHRDVSITRAMEEMAPNGVDVLWETLREPDFDHSVRWLAERGRMILMAGRDARPPFPVGPFYVKACSLYGFVMFKATAEEQQRCAEDINRWLSEGSLSANIDRVMPLTQAAEAHRLQEQNTIHNAGVLKGKIVIEP